MSIYFINYFLIILSNIINLKFSSNIKRMFSFITIIYFIFFIGLRYEIGGDWNTYLFHYNNFYNTDFFSWDIGYMFLQLFSHIFNLNIYGVNLLCSIIFFISFIYFIKVFKVPLKFALLVAYPYLILIVVAGYVRQGVAIGFSMLFFALIYSNKYSKAFFSFIFALLFHKSAIISLFIIILNKKIINIRFIILMSVFIGVLCIIFFNRFYYFYSNYIIDTMQSTGAIIRIVIFAVPIFIFILFQKKYNKRYNDIDFWKPLVYLLLVLFIFAVEFNTTTMSDRLLLYFYPLQMVLLYRIIFIFENKYVKYSIYISIVFSQVFILYGWMTFAKHRFYWIPYDNILFRIL